MEKAVIVDSEEQYLIDGVGISWNDLIRRAEQVGDFADPCFQTTSEAAAILRKAGHRVVNNPWYRRA